MASHYVSINRGVEGTKYSDVTTGTSSASTDKIELRVLDGAGLRVKDVILALDAFQRVFENAQRLSAGGFDVTG